MPAASDRPSMALPMRLVPCSAFASPPECTCTSAIATPPAFSRENSAPEQHPLQCSRHRLAERSSDLTRLQPIILYDEMDRRERLPPRGGPRSIHKTGGDDG